MSLLAASASSQDQTFQLLIACLFFFPAHSFQVPLGDVLATQDSSAHAGKAERQESTDRVRGAREFRCVFSFLAFSEQGWALLGSRRPSVKEQIWLSHPLTCSALMGKGSPEQVWLLTHLEHSCLLGRSSETLTKSIAN